MEESGFHCSSVERDGHAHWMLGTHSKYRKPAASQFSAFRYFWFRGWPGDNICCLARPDRNAQATLNCGHESEDGGHYRLLPDPLDLLWHPDYFATCRRVEPDRCVH